MAKGTGNKEMQEIDQEIALRAHTEPKDKLQSFNRAAIESRDITTRSLLLINDTASAGDCV